MVSDIAGGLRLLCGMCQQILKGHLSTWQISTKFVPLWVTNEQKQQHRCMCLYTHQYLLDEISYDQNFLLLIQQETKPRITVRAQKPPGIPVSGRALSVHD